MSQSRLLPGPQNRPRPLRRRASGNVGFISPARLSRAEPVALLTTIRPGMVELGCLRLADPGYPGPAVIEAIARRLVRSGK